MECTVDGALDPWSCFDGDDDFGGDDEDKYRCNSVNFQARPPDFAWK